MNLVFGSEVAPLGFWEYMFGNLVTVQPPPHHIVYLGTGWAGKILLVSARISRVLYSKFSLVCSEKDRVTQTASFWPFLA